MSHDSRPLAVLLVTRQQLGEYDVGRAMAVTSQSRPRRLPTAPMTDFFHATTFRIERSSVWQQLLGRNDWIHSLEDSS